MKILPVIVFAVVIASLGSTTAQAQQSASCYISPNPDAVGTPYTVYASGLQQGTDYVLHMTEATQSTEQHKLDTILQPDANGNASYNGDWSGPRGLWVPGTVKAAISQSSGRGFNTTGGKLAYCSFIVT